MSDDKQLKLKAQQGLRRILKSLQQDSYVEPPEQVIGMNDYGRLNRLLVVQGVILLVMALNLSGGSVGDMDLYKLVYTYLHDGQARTEINAIVKRYPD